MSYLQLTPSRVILGCFLISSLLLWKFPVIDLQISKLFFESGFFLAKQWWHTPFHRGMPYFLGSSLVSVVGIYVFNRFAKRTLCALDGKKVVYLFLVLIIGSGLIVNGVLKENFGRARPRDIAEFGGSRHFTAAFVIADECQKNCAFSSGHAAAGFFSLALARALSRKRAAYRAAVVFGTLVSFSRIAVGAHFFSDCVVSFFIMLIVSDVLYHYMVLPERERTPADERGHISS